MQAKCSTLSVHDTVTLYPSLKTNRVIVYHTGGGETADVLFDRLNEKRGIFQALVSAGYLVSSVTSTRDHWGSPESIRANDLLFERIESEFGIDKVAILCQSMGGLSAYNWTARNLGRVLGIYGIYPVTNLGSMIQGELGTKIEAVYGRQGIDLRKSLPAYDPITQIETLDMAAVPAMHRHGDADLLVKYRENALDFARAYRDSGGVLDLATVRGLGHEANPAFFKPKEVLAMVNSLEWVD